MKSIFRFLITLTLILSSELIYSQSSNSFSMAFTGDAIITRKLSVYQEPEFVEMIKIIRDADLAFTNLEMLFHDYEMYPMHQSGGTYMRADPKMVNELKWAGFDMVSTANNHTGDYGVEGMRMTLKYVDMADIVHAGSGESLAEAREARFLESGKARVALISCASTFPDHSRAGKTRGDMPPRPGLSPLRYNTQYMVTDSELNNLMKLGKSMGLIDESIVDPDRIRLWGENFYKSEKSEIITTPNEEDLAEIAAVVRNASKLADITIVTIHAHERDGELTVPAQFLVKFAREMVDAGADIFVGHGPHVLRGIEMYKGKPILYSLGDFMFQNETLVRLPYENYERYDLTSDNHIADFNAQRYDNDTKGFPARPMVWESVIAYPEWQNGELKSLKLYPITLGFGKSVTVRGRPMLADEKLGKKIIQDLTDLSKPFGTTIRYKDGVGVVNLK